jgi:choline kinase
MSTSSLGMGYQAVILAAGRGTRLHQYTRETPKAILPIGPRSRSDESQTNFLRRQSEILVDLGVEDIVIVVGFLKELILAEAERWELPLRFVVNTAADIGTSGSLHSFQFAARSSLGVLDGRKQTLLMDGDIVYHRGALRKLVDAPAVSALLVTEKYRREDEAVLVYGTVGRPRFLGKALSAPLVADEPCLGEALGIVKFAPRDHAIARVTMDWMLGDPDAPEGTPRQRGFAPARRATEHEELTQRFMHYRKIRCVMVGDDLPFMECDDAGDYSEIRDSFYPRLLAAEASDGDAA